MRDIYCVYHPGRCWDVRCDECPERLTMIPKKPKGQTRKQSLIESCTNIAVGYTVNVFSNALVLPLFGITTSMTENLELGLVYTAISLVRTYALRRYFNRATKA